ARPAQSIDVDLDRVRPAGAAAASRDGSPEQQAAARGTAAEQAAANGRYTGLLMIDSRPTGADVYLDGKRIGQTPIAVNTDAGEHAVRIERDGYRRWTASARVVATERNKVTAALER